MLYVIGALLVGILLGFGGATVGATKVIRNAVAMIKESNATAARWRALASEKAAHADHLRRMLQHTRATRSAVQMFGLAKGAGGDDVRAQFRRIAAKAHPDRGGDPEVFAMVVRVKDAAMREIGS